MRQLPMPIHLLVNYVQFSSCLSIEDTLAGWLERPVISKFDVRTGTVHLRRLTHDICCWIENESFTNVLRMFAVDLVVGVRFVFFATKKFIERKKKYFKKLFVPVHTPTNNNIPPTISNNVRSLKYI
jgi:hypothetical protein